MKIALASDHAGYAEKERLKPLLHELGLVVDDSILGGGMPPFLTSRYSNSNSSFLAIER